MNDLDTDFDIIGDLREPGLSYEYHILRMYRRKTDGALFTATDRGCSCPSPFEYHTVADLTPYSEGAVREWATENRVDPGALLALCKEGNK